MEVFITGWITQYQRIYYHFECMIKSQQPQLWLPIMNQQSLFNFKMLMINMYQVSLFLLIYWYFGALLLEVDCWMFGWWYQLEIGCLSPVRKLTTWIMTNQRGHQCFIWNLATLGIWGIDGVFQWERKPTQFSDTYWVSMTHNIIYTIYVLAWSANAK